LELSVLRRAAGSVNRGHRKHLTVLLLFLIRIIPMAVRRQPITTVEILRHTLQASGVIQRIRIFAGNIVPFLSAELDIDYLKRHWWQVNSLVCWYTEWSQK